MDFAEHFFAWVSNITRDRQRLKDLSHSYALDQCDVALGMMIQTFVENSVEVHAASRPGCRGLSFGFPKEIHYFNCAAENRNLYLHQALIMASASALRIFWNGEDRWRQFSNHQKRLLEFVTKIHPGFDSFHQELKTKYFKQIGSDNPITAQQLELFWGGLASPETEINSMAAPILSHEENEKKTSQDLEKEVDVEYESIDLQNEASNPITHSFEKLETADDYSGGRRVEDGSDQTDEHARALDGVRLKKRTRSAESASGFIKSSAMMSSLDPAVAHPTAVIDCVPYPEWDQKKRIYKLKHCSLYLVPSLPATGGNLFRQELEENYSHLIQGAQMRLRQICNQPKWYSKQKDGSEIDIDAFVHHLSDVRNKLPGSDQLYRNQKKRLQDFQVMVLIDSSLSTDSYVCNRRVLDVALESTGLLGLLGAGFADNAIVARTFSETRHHCTFEILKAENEAWKCFFERAPHVSPQGYTRLGPAIRHSIQLLSQCRAKKKFLLILSDGKPTDFDGYEGRYGIEDIRKACLEAEAKNICTKAFAIEKSARHYFPQMFISYEVLNSPGQMPESLVKTFLQSLR